jgi:hypothetical protein
MSPDICELKDLVVKLRQEKYPDAKATFFAGSMVRGEGTSTSDLDVVVLYEHLPNAYRDSFNYDGWPVEVFVHDPQTLKYFIYEVDAPSGYPSLAAMVSEGLEIPASTDFSFKIKAMANEALLAGPPKWSKNAIDSSRYLISDLIEDIKEPRSLHELHATASVLYSAMSNHYFRSKGAWSAKGKTIPRKLQKADPAFASRFCSAFDLAFVDGNPEGLVTLGAELLENDGGFHFVGYRVEAPPEWRG